MSAQVAGLLLLVSMVGAALAAPDLSGFSREGCPEASAQNWCASKLRAGGWRLRYESKSPPDLMDAFWNYEIWARGRDTVLCMFIGGRGGIGVNTCNVLQEVGR
jgi:hypothetical protein